MLWKQAFDNLTDRFHSLCMTNQFDARPFHTPDPDYRDSAIRPMHAENTRVPLLRLTDGIYLSPDGILVPFAPTATKTMPVRQRGGGRLEGKILSIT